MSSIHPSMQNLEFKFERLTLTLLEPYVLAPKKSREASGMLERILAINPQEITRMGVPLIYLEAWRDKFYEGISEGRYQVQVSHENTWAYNFYFLRKNEAFASCQAYFDNCFQTMGSPSSMTSKVGVAYTLNTLYSLYKTVSFPPNDPVEQIFILFMHCNIERMLVHRPEYRDKTFFLLDNIVQVSSEHIKLCCYKTALGFRIGDTLTFPDTALRVARFNINNTRLLILDKKNTMINRSCVVIEAGIRPGSKYRYAELVKVHMVFYKGAESFSLGRRNATVFTFDIHPKLSPTLMENFQQDTVWVTDPEELVPAEQRLLVEKEAQCMLEAFQDELTKPFIKDPSAHVAFELMPPESHSDKLWVINFLLKELQKNPNAHAEELIHIAELMNRPFSKKEVKALEARGKEWPEALVIKLLEYSNEQLKVELQKEKEAPALKPPASGPEEKEREDAPADRQAPQQKETPSLEDEMARIRLEKQAEKARRKALFEERQKQAEAKDEDDIPQPQEQEEEEEVLSEFSISTFNRKEKAQIASIYAGQPMQAKKFAQFAMKLMTKKAKSVAAAVQPHKKGSHQKLHFKQEKGPSGGITFHLHHGGDDHGNRLKQIKTLREIFSL